MYQRKFLKQTICNKRYLIHNHVKPTAIRVSPFTISPDVLHSSLFD